MINKQVLKAITSPAKLFLFAVFYGIAESLLMLNCSGSGNKIIGPFSLYHIAMLFVFLSASYGVLKGWVYLPLLFVIEDITFYLFRMQWPAPGDWVSNILGGFFFLGFYIPFAYLVGIVVFFILTDFLKDQ